MFEKNNSITIFSGNLTSAYNLTLEYIYQTNFFSSKIAKTRNSDANPLAQSARYADSPAIEPTAGRTSGERMSNGTRQDEFPSDGDELSEDSEQSKNLSRRVAELKNNLGCLLNSKGLYDERLVQVDGRHWVRIEGVRLPSNHKVYVGYYANRMVVSDGDIYHIDFDESVKPLGFMASLACLLAHLTHGYSMTAPSLPEERHNNHQTATGADHHRQLPAQDIHAQHRPVAAITWRETISKWFNCLYDPLTFPQAAAQMTDAAVLPPPQRDFIYAGTAEFVARLGSYVDSREAEMGQNSAANNIDSFEIVQLPVSTALNFIRDKKNDDSAITGTMKFLVDGMEMTLSLPNQAAKNLMMHLQKEFLQENIANPFWLEQLLEFDEFIGKRILKVLYQGLFLKDRSKALDTIILKKQTEALIKVCMEATQVTDQNKDKIFEYTQKQIKISDYLVDLKDQLAIAHKSVDYKIIVEAVEIRKNIPLSEVFDNIAAQKKEASAERQIHLDKLIKVLNIMHEAHNEYCDQLYPDDDPTLDRVLYLNTKSIYQALIYDEADELTKSLLKLRFYYIFEYTRVNGISVYSFNFIVPGEMTDSWRMFEENEPDLIHEKMDQMFERELLSVLSFQSEGYPTLAKLNKIIELTRLDGDYLPRTESWHIRNLFPFQKTYKILAESIESYEIEQKKLSYDIAWSKDLNNILYKSKTTFVMLIYMKKFQELFNEQILYYLSHKPVINAKTQMQRMACAKIEAYRSSYTAINNIDDDNLMLVKFEEKVNEGNLEVFLRAVVFWFFSNINDIDDELLTNQSVLYISQTFLFTQKVIFHDYLSRKDKLYSSVYQLETSSKMSLENYYQQFIDYKKYDSHSEARKLTCQALEIASINYFDIIFPPKEIYTFQVYSRNYVGNSLAPHGYFSSPKPNLGYISIIKTYTNGFVMLSTLAGFPLVLKITEFEHSLFFKTLIQDWNKEKGNLAINNRMRISVDATGFLSLFLQIKNDFGDREILVEMLAKAPQPLIDHIPVSAYSLVAIKDTDILACLKPYMSSMQPELQILGLNTPLLDVMDYLNQATLIAITDHSKVTLREYSWLEYVANFIPFFEVGVRHWYDKEHQIKFHEIIFDLFDVMTAIVSGSISLKRIAGSTFKQALQKAIDQKIPHHLVKEFLIKELVLETPNAGMAAAKVVLTELASALNPLPFSENLFTKLVGNIYKEIRSSISLTNNAIARNKLVKNNLRNQWRIIAGTNAVEQNNDGAASEPNAGQVFFIRDKNAEFQVIRDIHLKRWRVINAKLPDYDSAIPVTKSLTGEWIAQDFRQSNRDISSYDFFYGNQAESCGLESIDYEPLFVPESIKPEYYDIDAFNKKLLRFYLYKKDIFQKIMVSKKPNELFLEQIDTRAIFHNVALEINRKNIYSPDDQLVLDEIKRITDEKDGTVWFRAITSWRNKKDQQPITHHALRVDIKSRKYIIELKEVRAHLCMSEGRDVFTHDEWLMSYSAHSSNQFELIKYKDFDALEEAKYFSVRETTSASNFIKKGILLKEPLWYKPLLIEKYNKVHKLSYNTNNAINHDYRSIARTLRQNRKNFALKEEFPLHILGKSGVLPQDKLAILIPLVHKAKHSPLNSYAILNDKLRINNMNNLSLVKEGKLLAMYRPGGRLEHLMLSLGDGRFIGMNNRLFSPLLPERAGIVLAEQMGKFADDLLTLHHTDNKFLVWVGNAYGAKDDTPIMFSQKKTKFVPVFYADGRMLDYKEVSVSRNEILLGEDCQVSLINEVPSRLQIKLHGAPFNLNHMDATEFADVVRGLPYIENNDFKLERLESIELYTCYGGYGGRFSTAQILADELNVAIKAYPHKISGALRIRRPEWFTIYRPLINRPTHAADGHLYIFPGSEFRWPQAIHRKLHYLMNILRRATRIASTARNKREDDFITDYQFIAPIYTDVLALINPKDQTIPDKIGHLSLSAHSRNLIRQINDDYGYIDPDEPRLVEQAYLDLLLSVPELQYLTHRFNDIPDWLDERSSEQEA